MAQQIEMFVAEQQSIYTLQWLLFVIQMASDWFSFNAFFFIFPLFLIIFFFYVRRKAEKDVILSQVQNAAFFCVTEFWVLLIGSFGNEFFTEISGCRKVSRKIKVMAVTVWISRQESQK